MDGMTNREDSNATITDDELAACLAAVYAYMAAEDQAIEQEPAASRWLLASRLESVGINSASAVTLPFLTAKNLWRFSNLPCLIALILSATTFISPFLARAQSSDGNGQFHSQSPAADNSTTDVVNAEYNSGNDDHNNGDHNIDSRLYNLYRAAALRKKTIALAGFYPAQTGSYQIPTSPSPDKILFSPAAPNSPCLIRVGLVLSADKIQIATPDGAEVFDLQSNNMIARLAENSRFHAQTQPGQTLFVLDDNGARNLPQLGSADGQIDPVKPVSYTPLALAPHTVPTGSFALDNTIDGGCLVLAAKEDGVILVNGKAYRGGIRLCPDGKGKLKAINIVSVEDYLLSVVPSEMPSSWSPEALKAQAIAARSYALANIGKHDADGFDVKPTTEDQVYAGCAAETDATNLAVAQTDSLVLRQNQQVIAAYFHSGAGGYTEEPESFNGAPAPYLHAVPDYDDRSPLFSWSQSFTLSKLEDSLRRNGHDTGDLLDVMIVSRTPANRVKQVLLMGTNTCRIVDGDELRRVFKLPSSIFNVGQTGNSYVFAGRGFGHGLGLSQWGAKELAEHGYNAAQILTYYYKDVTIERL
jgi:stage II sporulation protein D